MDETKVIKVGENAPDFTLKDHFENEITLSAFRGKNVLLSFHPLAWTAVCADQMRSLEENHPRFEELNTIALGMSVDTVPSKKAWAENLGIKNTSLVSDFWPHGEAAKSLGIFRETNGISERVNIIIDEEGKVVFVKVYPIRELPDIKEVIEFLERKNK